MIINLLTEEERCCLIEGYYFFPIEKEEETTALLTSLIEWHETNDLDLQRGLDYWYKGIGKPVWQDGYDYEFRKRAFDK